MGAKGRLTRCDVGCQLLTVCQSEESGMYEYWSVSHAGCYWQQLDVFTYTEDVQAPATRKTNGSEDRGFAFKGTAKSAFRRVSPYSTILIGQPGNNGSEYCRFEDDDHEWWRVIEVYNILSLADLSFTVIAQDKRLIDIPYTSLFSPRRSLLRHSIHA
jgi:hypothetical protein